jgi:metal-responsive CopG/Arc/MetJ family transcriptional regulator
MPKLSVRFPPTLVAVLDQRVHLEGTDRSKVINDAVRSYLGTDSSGPDLDDHERRISRLEQMANLD